MQQDRWERVKEIFGTAVEFTAQRRRQFLDAACVGDTQLRAEVDSLLAAHESSDSFINQPAALALQPQSTRPSWIGRRVGPYRIEEEVGRGGMSEVYRAVRADEEYQKEVAVKVIGAGIASDTLLRHFRLEKQLLAKLDHP